jgi:hypothetical protein
MDFDFLALVVGNQPSGRNAPFYGELGNEMKRRGYSFAGITTSRFADRVMADYGHPYFNLHDMIGELRSRRNINYAEEAKRIEQTYGISINNYCLAEAMLEAPHVKNDRQLFEEVIEDYILVEEFFQQHQVGYLIQNQGGEIIRRALSRVGTFRDIPSTWINWSPLGESMFIYPDENTSRNGIGRIKSINELSEDEVKEATSYIATFRYNSNMYLHHRDLHLAVKPRTLIRPLRELYRKYRVNQGQEPRKVLRLYWRSIFMELERLYYDFTLPRSTDGGEGFFFLPLHFPRESQLTIRAPHCLDQEAIVAMVARSLPTGYRLYVKEHPNHIGEIPRRVIKQISRMKDVVLLHPRAHSHELIQKSAGTVVINSTAGFESILYQKPVVVLGKPFYSGLGLTIDVDDYSCIPEALQRALNLGEIPYESVITFVDTLRKGSYPGRYGDASERNIQAVTDSILSYLGKVRPK